MYLMRIGERGREKPVACADATYVDGSDIVGDFDQGFFGAGSAGGQRSRGASCETFNPAGPWLVTPDEIADVLDLAWGWDSRRRSGCQPGT